MADVPKIFISYAQDDDVIQPQAADGWVTAFTNWLEVLLPKKFTREFRCQLYRDLKFLPGDYLSDEIARQVRASSVFLVLLSPNYFASTWCRWERELFVETERARRPGLRPRILPVGIDEVDPSAELAQVLNIRFWERDVKRGRNRPIGYPTPDSDPRSIDLMFDIVEGIKKKLAEDPAAGAVAGPAPAAGPAAAPAGPLTPAGAGPAAPATPAGPRPTLFLAEATDDLDDLRNELVRSLPAQYRVVPEGLYPSDDAGFRAAVTRDLADATLFVQLLDEGQGRKLVGSDARRVAVQYDLAAGKPGLQWRKPGLDWAAVQGDRHRALLEGATLFTTVIFEDFKTAVAEKMAALLRPADPAPEPLPAGIDCLIVVVSDDATAQDKELLEAINGELTRRRAEVMVPLRTGKPEDDRKSYEKRVQACDGLLLVYGNTDPDEITHRWLQSRKVLSKRDVPIRAVGIYEGPPPPKPDLGIKSSNLYWLRCAAGLQAAEIDEFLSRVRTGGGGA